MSYLVLACTGLDKAEGSVAREVALRLAEEDGAEIVCPVVLNRTPARYQKALAEERLVVVDGCATRCAGRLAASAGAKPSYMTQVSETMKRLDLGLAPGLRLGPDGLELAAQIVDEIVTRDAAARQTAGEIAQGKDQPDADDGAAGEPTGSNFPSPGDFLVIVHDKYEFRIPLPGYYFNGNDVWVQVAGNRARVGISDYMQQRLTDITYVDPRGVGTTVEQFDELGTVESTKATFELISPVGGTIVAVNSALEDAPEAINEDPYGSWIVELELNAWKEDSALLSDGPAYAAEVERRAAEDGS
jgi:glycine cleavage system H protein